MKVIKFVNSTVKCNVNFPFELRLLEILYSRGRLCICLLLCAYSLDSFTMNVQRLWNESNNFMQHKIKSDLVISRFVLFAILLHSHPEPFSHYREFRYDDDEEYKRTEKKGNCSKRGWNSNLNSLLSYSAWKIPSNVVSIRFKGNVARIHYPSKGNQNVDVDFLLPSFFGGDWNKYNGVIRFAQNVVRLELKIFNFFLSFLSEKGTTKTYFQWECLQNTQ